MDRNSVYLKDIIWVIGYKETKEGKKIFNSIPYVKEVSIKGYEDLIDLTEIWRTVYDGKVTDEDIKRKFEKVHDAKAIKVVNSANAIKSFVLNFDNKFKDEIEGIKEKYSLGENCVELYCDLRVLTSEEGSELIKTINKGVKTKYNKSKESANALSDEADANL